MSHKDLILKLCKSKDFRELSYIEAFERLYYQDYDTAKVIMEEVRESIPLDKEDIEFYSLIIERLKDDRETISLDDIEDFLDNE